VLRYRLLVHSFIQTMMSFAHAFRTAANNSSTWQHPRSVGVRAALSRRRARRRNARVRIPRRSIVLNFFFVWRMLCWLFHSLDVFSSRFCVLRFCLQPMRDHHQFRCRRVAINVSVRSSASVGGLRNSKVQCGNADVCVSKSQRLIENCFVSCLKRRAASYRAKTASSNHDSQHNQTAL
jgi:hypothetical protein